MGGGAGMQMSALQHQQQIRTPSNMVMGGMNQQSMAQVQGGMQQGPPMGAQINMNQQMISHMQQQGMMQQNTAQVKIKWRI